MFLVRKLIVFGIIPPLAQLTRELVYIRGECLVLILFSFLLYYDSLPFICLAKIMQLSKDGEERR